MRVNLGGIIPLSTMDWTGVAATVVFLRGCPLRCPHCQNRELQTGETVRDITFFNRNIKIGRNRSSWETPRHASPPELQTSLLEFEIPFPQRSAIILSGGEPLMQPDTAIALARLAREQGLKVGIETSGYYPDRLKAMIEEGLVDMVFLDIKAALQEDSYARATGSTHAASYAAQSLEILMSAGIPFEVRVTVFPEMPEPSELIKIAAAICELRDRYPENRFETLVLQQGQPLEREFQPVSSGYLSALASSIKGLDVRVVERPRRKQFSIDRKEVEEV